MLWVPICQPGVVQAFHQQQDLKLLHVLLFSERGVLYEGLLEVVVGLSSFLPSMMSLTMEQVSWLRDATVAVAGTS